MNTALQRYDAQVVRCSVGVVCVWTGQHALSMFGVVSALSAAQGMAKRWHLVFPMASLCIQERTVIGAVCCSLIVGMFCVVQATTATRRTSGSCGASRRKRPKYGVALSSCSSSRSATSWRAFLPPFFTNSFRLDSNHCSVPKFSRPCQCMHACFIA